MEHYIGLGIILFFMSMAAWIWLEIYRAKKALDEERIRRLIAEHELREAKKRAEFDAMSVDELIKQRRDKGKTR